MRNFKDLEIWRIGHEMTLNIYKVIEPFPDDENYGLKAQMRRSAQSIPSNIAEGCGRDSVKELIRFCRIAMGSASELEYQLLLSKDLGYLNVKDYDTLENALLTLKKKLSAFLRYLKKPNTSMTKKPLTKKPLTKKPFDPLTQKPTPYEN